MSDSKVQISIPEELIRSMVSGAVVQQLGNPQEVAARMMAEVLLLKTRKPGGDGYSRDEKPLLEWLFYAEIERIAREEVKAFLESNRDDLRASIKAAIKSPRYQTQLAQALLGLISDNAYLQTSVELSIAMGLRK